MSMAEDLYAKVDLKKKVRFGTGEREDSKAGVCEDIESVKIYDNCWAEGGTPPKSPDSTTDVQQQSSNTSVSTSVDVSSGKRRRHGAAAVFLGLLSLLFLASLVVLVVLWIQDKNSWNREIHQLRTNIIKLTSERERTEGENNHLKAVNRNLTEERDELETNYSEMESLSHNLTQKTNQLESEISHLKAVNSNLTEERDELRNQIEKTCRPDSWTKFDKSFYFVSTTKTKWSIGREVCESLDAHLVIIDNLQEQTFISQLDRSAWIGLQYEKQQKQWRWVDGTPVKQTFWVRGQPTLKDSKYKPEHCVTITAWKPPEENWDDKDCENALYHFICEKTLQ